MYPVKRKAAWKRTMSPTPIIPLLGSFTFWKLMMHTVRTLVNLFCQTGKSRRTPYTSRNLSCFKPSQHCDYAQVCLREENGSNHKRGSAIVIEGFRSLPQYPEANALIINETREHSPSTAFLETTVTRLACIGEIRGSNPAILDLLGRSPQPSGQIQR